MTPNEYEILEKLILYHREKTKLDMNILEKRLNDRINKLNIQVDDLLNELKVVTIKEVKEVERAVFDNNYHDTNYTQ